MKICRINRILIIILIFFPYLSWAADWYVDNAANGSNNGRSWQNAWESFADIDWGQIGSNATIYISGGSNGKNYFETLVVGASGAPGSPITITAGIDNNHDGTVIINGEDARNCIDIQNKEYIEISYIQCDNGLGQTVRIDESESIKIFSCTFKNINTQGAVFIEESVDCVISYNTITTVDDTFVQVDGIYAQKNNGNIYENNHITILNNNDTPHCDGIQLFQETNFTIRGNIITILNNSNANKQGIFCTNNYGENLIYNNLVIYDTGAWASIIGFLNFDSQNTGTVHIHNNTTASLSGTGWAVSIIGDDNAKIKNNIFWKQNSNSALVLFGESGNEVSFFPGNIDYNLYYAQGGTNIISYNGSSLNLTDWQNLNQGAGSLNSDPSLNRFYRPDDVNDPVVDTGVSLNDIFTTDLDGIRRPQGAAWDMGAYEFVSEISDSGGGAGGGCFISTLSP